MVKIARWNHDGGTQSGFVDGENCYALPAGQGVQTLLDAGLEETLALARQTSGSTRPFHWRRCSYSPRWSPPPSGTSWRSRNTLKACGRASTAWPASCPNGTEAPTFYFTNPHTVTGTGEVIGIPAGCDGPGL